MTITVYSKDDCRQCDMTKKVLTSEGHEYLDLDLTAPEQAEQLEKFKEGGTLQMPVVVVSKGDTTEKWTGFRPDLIKGLALQAV